MNGQIRIFSRLFVYGAVVCCALLLCGCPRPQIGGDMPPAPRALSPLDEAKDAYVRGDYSKAETMALRLSTDSSLGKSDTVEANRVLAAAALKNNHPSVALNALDQWRIALPGADNAKEWQDAWCKALRGLSSHDARTRANELYQDSSRSALSRSVAGVFLAVRQWQDGEVGQTMPALENIYSSAASVQDKAAIEGRLALELSLASQAAVTLAFESVTDANKGKFPYSIILVEKLRRESMAPGTKEEAQAALNSLPGIISLADPSLVGTPPKESEIHIGAPSGGAVAPSGPIAGQPVVLALPMSGQFGAVSSKIVAGARVACDELSAQGRQVSLIVLDTDQPDWVAKADALPANAALIGGPMRKDDYARAKQSGLTSRRTLFTFMASLDPGDEGRTAWRFFTGAQDQVDTLLAFTSRLGIRGYGIFYPEDNYGRRMASLFEERANAQGGRAVVSQGYVPGDQNAWMEATNSLLAANKSGSAFQAVFLPDTWKNMDVIVPNFFYQNETRQVLLGTTLWEQGLSSSGFVSMQYYNLAVFPGNWNPAAPGSAGQRLRQGLQAAGGDGADFWSGLGYDFARLSANLGIATGANPATVNAALQSARLDWTIAPISWSSGVASQQMHLFTPSSSGFTPVDEGAFRAAFDEAWR